MALEFGAATLPLGAAKNEIARVLAPSVERNPLEALDDVMDEVEAGTSTAWLVSEGDKLHSVTITSVFTNRTAKQCVIRHCAGMKAREWVKFLRVIELWAIAQGCDSIELVGRPGWQKLVDWPRAEVVLRKVL